MKHLNKGTNGYGENVKPCMRMFKYTWIYERNSDNHQSGGKGGKLDGSCRVMDEKEKSQEQDEKMGNSTEQLKSSISPNMDFFVWRGI